MEKRVVILGAGFGGIRVALDLLKSKVHFKITLVNDSPYHSYHPDLYEVTTAKVLYNNKLAFENLFGTINIPLNKIFRGRKIEILIDQVKKIDLDKKEVYLSGLKLEYDYLIIALGSTTNYLGIEGASNYSHPFKNTEDALNIRNDLCEISSGGRVIIAGGGFTGVELAGLLIKFLKDRIRLKIIETSDHLLGGMPEWAGRLAESRLKKLGVELNLGCQISRIDQKTIYGTKGEKISYDYLIWTAGVTGVALEGGIKGTGLDDRYQIEVGSDLSIKDHKEAWVIGDMAKIMDKNGCPVPQTVWAALGQARVAAKNIINEKAVSYHAPTPRFVVPVGPYWALSNIYSLKIYGLTAWIIKMYISLGYMLSILPPALALQKWWKGVKIRINE